MSVIIALYYAGKSRAIFSPSFSSRRAINLKSEQREEDHKIEENVTQSIDVTSDAWPIARAIQPVYYVARVQIEFAKVTQRWPFSTDTDII